MAATIDSFLPMEHSQQQQEDVVPLLLGAVVVETTQEEITHGVMGLKRVRFDDAVKYLPQVDGDDETDQKDEVKQQRWFSQAEIASFREDAIRTVQAANNASSVSSDYDNNQELLDEEQFCLRGLEKKMLKRPPPNFVKTMLRLQAHQKRTGNGDLATSLQLFSISSSKWARKRALQLAAEDEYDAYHIFMAGLRKTENNTDDVNDINENGDCTYDDDDEEEEDYFDDEFDFCTESDFVNEIYDCKNSNSIINKYHQHDSTEDETEYDETEYDLEDCEAIFASPSSPSTTPASNQIDQR